MIRQATTADLPKLEELAIQFYGMSKFLTGFNIAAFTGSWEYLLASGMGVIFLSEVEGEIRGALGAMAHPDVNSGRMIASEFFWFMHPNYRGGGMRLLQAYEDWAKERGCTEVRMVHLMDLGASSLKRIYERRGYEAAEIHYRKEVA